MRDAPARQLPEFSRRLHVDISCALNTLLVHERYDAPRELFDSRGPHYQRLLDAPAQATRLIYDHVNCVAAGLVSRPEHMPGHTFDFRLWKRGYLDVRRPDIYFSNDEAIRPAVIRMRVTPPPLLYEAFGGDLERLVHHMQRLVEEATRKLRALQRRAPMGARAVQRLHPWSEPRSLRESGGQRRPSFSVGAQGVLGLERHVEAATETRNFRQRYSEVREARRDGDLARSFPFGTYAMRVWHGAPVESLPDSTKWIARPGPLLEDVKRRLAAETESAPGPEQGFAVIDEVRAGIEHDAESLSQHEELDFSPEPTEVDAGIVQQRPAKATRHRFDRRSTERGVHQAGPEGARRLVILRDRRRGRPPSRGADPPA